MCFIAGTQALRKLGVKFIVLGTFPSEKTSDTISLRFLSALSYVATASATWLHIHEDYDNQISNVTLVTGIASAVACTLVEFALIVSTKQEEIVADAPKVESAKPISEPQQAFEEILVR